MILKLSTKFYWVCPFNSTPTVNSQRTAMDSLLSSRQWNALVCMWFMFIFLLQIQQCFISSYLYYLSPSLCYTLLTFQQSLWLISVQDLYVSLISLKSSESSSSLFIFLFSQFLLFSVASCKSPIFKKASSMSQILWSTFVWAGNRGRFAVKMARTGFPSNCLRLCLTLMPSAFSSCPSLYLRCHFNSFFINNRQLLFS